MVWLRGAIAGEEFGENDEFIPVNSYGENALQLPSSGFDFSYLTNFVGTVLPDALPNVVTGATLTTEAVITDAEVQTVVVETSDEPAPQDLGDVAAAAGEVIRDKTGINPVIVASGLAALLFIAILR